MNLDILDPVIEFMNREEMTVVSFSLGGLKVKLVKDPGTFRGTGSGEKEKAGKETRKKEVFITSPVVGIFFSTATSDNYETIELNDVVRKGQVVCMIQSMGLEHLIRSEYEGRVKEICVEDAQPVEFNQKLFVLETE